MKSEKVTFIVLGLLGWICFFWAVGKCGTL